MTKSKNKTIAQSITAACKKAAQPSPSKKRKQAFTEDDPAPEPKNQAPTTSAQAPAKKQKKDDKPSEKSPEALFEKFFDELHDQPGATDQGYTFITSTAKDKDMKRMVTVKTSLVRML